MPDHIMQNLYIEADEATLKQIHDLVFVDEEDAFSANRIVPMPEELKNLGTVNIQNWTNEYWGTSHGIYDAEWESLEQVWFVSAWCEATMLISKLSERFPEAVFELDCQSESDELIAYYKIQNGNILEYNEYEGVM